jgi:hypothetical protein
MIYAGRVGSATCQSFREDIVSVNLQHVVPIWFGTCE